MSGNYIISNEAISNVYKLLNELISVPLYMNTKPSESKVDEYIVINALPINARIMQKCRINVNYHVKDFDAGEDLGFVCDDASLGSGSRLVISTLDGKTVFDEESGDTYLLDFEGQETIREDYLNEHYSNLKFSYKHINN